MGNKREEIKPEEGVTVGYEMRPLEASSTEEYTLWQVKEIWASVAFRVGTDDFKTGFNFSPTFGHEVRVVLSNTGAVLDEIPTGTIGEEVLSRQIMRLADYVTTYRSRVITSIQSANNPEKGF